MNERKPLKWLLIIGGIAIGGLILLSGLFVLASLLQTTPSVPMITIHAPAHGEQIQAGQVVDVQSTSRDELHKIVKVELWEVKGEQLRFVGAETPIESSHVFSVPLGWQPLEEGNYRLILRVYNDQDRYGVAAVDVQVLETSEDLEPVALVRGDAPAIPGGFDISDVPGVESVEETEDPDQPITPPNPNPDPPESPTEVDFGGLILQNIGDFFTPEAYFTWVELEAVAFEVVEDYSGVYCYAELASTPWGRIPETGFLDSTSQNHWNIEAYLGGENTVIIPLFREQSLDLILSCKGYRDNELYNIGYVSVTHPPEDWHGQLIHTSEEYGEGFTVSYRINPVGKHLEAPVVLHQISWGQKKYFHWAWNGDPASIDGFRLYRNNTLVATFDSDVNVVETPSWWTVPPCEEEYEYYIVAYQGALESPTSNYLRYQGEACKGDADITYVGSVPNCDGTGQRYFVKYNYPSSEPANIRIRVFQGGQMAQYILSTQAQITSGQGVAQIALTYHGFDPITTDKIVIYIDDQNGQTIYSESFDRMIEWQPGQTDLIIKEAWVDRENHQLKVHVRNDGCVSPPAIDPLISITREADGWTGFEQMEVKLFARTERVHTIDLNPEEMGLWGGKVTLKVDPNDEIEESNNDNNGYMIGEARIKAVQLSKIIIYDDHDAGSNKGEIYLFFRWGSGTIERDYHWEEGEHALGDCYAYPTLADNEYLKIRISLSEEDDRPFNWRIQSLGSCEIIFSPDPLDENTWKAGGVFECPSDTWDFKAIFRIIME